MFASFFAVVEENGQLVYKKGWERIPENWYRIAVDFGRGDVNRDLGQRVAQCPKQARNGGKTNTFAGVDLHDVTGGVINATTLLEGNNLMCFVLQVVKTFAPNSLSPLFKTLEVPLKLVNDAVLNPLLDLSCPEWTDLTMDGQDLLTGLKAKYPGAARGQFAL